MLILLTLLLVLVGTVSLIIGFIQNSLVPIYASIGCSVAAAAVLVLYSRIANRPSNAARLGDTDASFHDEAEEPETTGPAPVVAPAAQVETPVVAPAAAVAEAGENPIADYHTLKVGEIVPLLSGLTVEQLHAVRTAEQAGKSRTTVLNRIEQLLNAPAGRPPRRTASRPAKKSSSRSTASGSGGGAKRPPKQTSAPAAPVGSAEPSAPAGDVSAPGQEPAAGPAAAPGADPDPHGIPRQEPAADAAWDPPGDPVAGNGPPTTDLRSSQTEAGAS